ncbi:Bax inhibitor-1 family protein [Lysinibacillus sp. 1 U-2021]|uniref:Bax inhibitor-1/YccA family protein n=1 Tax=Lysinibacillus sp. 1 U-2021 TaxID=3039426 RepID=UPI00247FADA8|nr:Bax inhibitor-1 family protein [Lysinibacillus sp. 1 U-2021]WGT37776.1 Bax inhibitor-1 family protein [Lysinibacillus sp. 1 U-2021]
MNKNLDKVLKMFGVMWVLTGVGMFLGQFIPVQYILPIAIITILLVIGMWFTAKSKMASSILAYLVSFLIGITLYSSIGFYVGELGLEIVVLVIGTCTVTFALLGLFGYKLQKDLKGWGMILFVALIGLVIFSFIAIFIGFSNLIMVIVSGLGVMIFLGFTIYDFNQIAQRGVEDNEVPITALNLYLDLVNLILEALRLVYYLKELLED